MHPLVVAAAGRYGLVRHEDLGLARNELRRRIRSGQLRPIRRHIYATHSADDRSVHEGVVAALMLLPAGSVACGLTAARLWRLDGPPPQRVDEPLHFLVPPNKHRVLDGCRLHDGAPGEVTIVESIPCTALAGTVLRYGSGVDLRRALIAVEAALRAHPALREQLEAELRERPPTRGVRQLRRVLEIASPLSESPLESIARLVWMQVGLPAPEQQVALYLRGRFIARVDFLWRAARLVVEVDGFAKYANAGEHRAEKARQNAIVAAGYTVLRFTWHDFVERPEAVATAVREALRQSVAS
jgi:hypothetical protein